MSESREIDWHDVTQEINLDWRRLHNKEKEPAKAMRLRQVVENAANAERQYISGQSRSGDFYLAKACDLIAHSLPDGAPESVERDRKLYYLAIAQRLYTKLGSTNEAREMESALIKLRNDQEGMAEAPEAPLPDLDKSVHEAPRAVIESVPEKPKVSDRPQIPQVSAPRTTPPVAGRRRSSGETEIQPGAVAMIGFSGSGKTVFASLFANFMYEAGEHLGMKIVLQDGFKTVGNNMEYILNKRQFPPNTQPGELRPIEIVLTKKAFPREKSVLLQVVDMAGEAFEKLVNSEVNDPVQFLRTFGRREGQMKGPYAFIFEAKALIITIDCSDYAIWQTKQFQYCTLLKVIRDGTSKERVTTPLAFVFTKCDLLPEEMRGSTGDDLLAKLPAVKNYVSRFYDPKKFMALAVNLAVESDAKGTHIPKLPLEYPKEGFTSFAEWAFKWL